MKITSWVWGLMLLAQLAGAQAVFAADDLALIRQRVAQVEVLRGAFEQEKHIAGFKKPLQSQGRFVVARNKGVIWMTEQPFASEWVITADRIVSRQPDGRRQIEVDGREQPALRTVNAMMFAMVSGDVAALSSRFRVQVQALPEQGWRLSLTPRSAALAQAFSRIVLSGDRYVREVQMEEANGDSTRLRFSQLKQAPATLDADEARRFD